MGKATGFLDYVRQDNTDRMIYKHRKSDRKHKEQQICYWMKF